MVAVKGPSTFKNRVLGDQNTRKSVGIRNFEVVYTENENVKSHGCDAVVSVSKRKPVPVKAKIGQANASDPKMKGALNKLEKSSGKSYDSVAAKNNAGRKILADISNFQGNVPRNEICDGSKLGKSKIERMRITSSQRTSGSPGARTASSSSSKPLTGKLLGSRSQTIGSYHTQGRGATQGLKVFNDDLGTKAESRKTVTGVVRKYATNLLPPTRKSLPVFKQADKVDTSDLKKGNAENKQKSKEKQGFPIKTKVGVKVVPHPQVSNTSSYLSRNRVSDGFIIMGGQSKGSAQTSSRRSRKPTVRTTVTNPKAQRDSKSKRTSVLSKSTFGASISSKRKEELATSALSEHTASGEPCEQPAKEEIPSNSKSNFEATTSRIIAKGRSDRRKSYTSLLISRSKLLKEHGDVTKQEFLPNIYDDCNHLEVAEYVDEIYQYYWVMEAQNQSLKNYMEIQTDIKPQMRGILINWLIEVHLKFDLMQETLYLMVTLLDQYLSLVSIKKNEMQLVGLTALLLASKYEDFWHPKVMELIGISAELYSRDQMLGMEKTILKKLKFRLNMPTPYVFMLRFLRAAQSDKKFENLAFYLIELCLVEYEALNFKPSLLCASAIYVARCTLQMTPAWTPLLGNHARYEEPQIRDCAEMILRFHRAARGGVLKVTYEKYMSTDNCRVAAIKPLDRLPP